MANVGAPIRGPDARLLGQAQRRADNRANALAAQLARWMERFARQQATEQIEALGSSDVVAAVFKARIAKASRRDLERELRALLVANGRAAFVSSTRRAARSRAAEVTEAAMRDFMASKEIRVQQIMRSTLADVQESIRQIIQTALAERPRPSTGEIARRIRSVYHGAGGGRPAETRIVDGVPVPVEVNAPLIDSRVLPTTRVRLNDGGNLYAFSSERAALIARTEMAQAENEGIVEGYKQTGVAGLRWLAYRDGRSGDRRHNEMHGETTPLGVPFVLPDGTRIMYPGWYLAPIKHTANCRCTTAPVFDL